MNDEKEKIYTKRGLTNLYLKLSRHSKERRLEHEAKRAIRRRTQEPTCRNNWKSLKDWCVSVTDVCASRLSQTFQLVCFN